jgi:hypothetical protein
MARALHLLTPIDALEPRELARQRGDAPVLGVDDPRRGHPHGELPLGARDPDRLRDQRSARRTIRRGIVAQVGQAMDALTAQGEAIVEQRQLRGAAADVDAQVRAAAHTLDDTRPSAGDGPPGVRTGWLYSAVEARRAAP